MSTTSINLRHYSLRRYRKWILPVAGIALLGEGAALGCGVHWPLLFKGLAETLVYFRKLLTPDWSIFGELLRPSLETIFIALVGTFVGTIVSLFFGLAAASNIAPPWLRQATRFLLGLERALPEIVILLFLVAAFGLGPFAGVLSLVIGCVGMLGKLFADAIEEVDLVTIESIEAVGASKVQVMVFGVLQQILPTVVSYALFRFELSMRLSIVLGAVGAGGIGLELYRAFTLLDYPRASSCLILVLVMVVLSERGSEFLRKKVKR
jgi:phosphonate transport system permease protein